MLVRLIGLLYASFFAFKYTLTRTERQTVAIRRSDIPAASERALHCSAVRSWHWKAVLLHILLRHSYSESQGKELYFSAERYWRILFFNSGLAPPSREPDVFFLRASTRMRILNGWMHEGKIRLARETRPAPKHTRRVNLRHYSKRIYTQCEIRKTP